MINYFYIKESIFQYICNYYREHGWDPSAVEIKLKELQEKGVVKAMEHGAFTRVVHQDTQVQVNFIRIFLLLCDK